MTQQEVMEWMEGYLVGTKAETSALGMIKADIREIGFDTFLELPPETINHTYLAVSEELAQELVDSFATMLAQDQDIADISIDRIIHSTQPNALPPCVMA